MPNDSLMNCARKTLPVLVATLAPFLSGTLNAAGFGELVAHSSLGEPLRAEVRLVRVAGETIDAGCFKAMNGTGEDIPWIHNLRVRLAGDRLVLSTREPVDHPVAMLGLRIACGAELRKEFTLLLSPPSFRDTERAVDLPVGNAPEVLEVPRRAMSADRRDTSAGAAPQRDIRPRAAVSPRPARTPPPQPSPRAVTSPATPPSTRIATPKRADTLLHQDRLLIGAGDEAALTPLRMSVQLANPPKSDDPGAQRPSLNPEQRTLAEIDDRIAAQIELDEKIKRLEEYQALLKERVAQLDLRKPAAAPSPAPMAAAAPAEAVPTTGGEIQSLFAQWAYPLGGLLAALVGGGALIYLRRRRNSPADAPAVSEAEFHTTLQHPEPVTATEKSIATAPAARPTTVEVTSALPEMRKPAAPLGAPASVDTPAEWAEPTFAPAHPIPFDETVDEHDSALELAEIMMSFGRTQGAAETLADYIRNNPRQAVKPWLKLLEVYHVAGMRAEFEALTRQLNKTFNVKMIGWSDFKGAHGGADTVEQMPHVVQRLQDLWGTQEAQAYIHQILRDNRNGTRQGFPLTVVEELLLLLAILDDELGAYKPPMELSLVDMEPPMNTSADSAAA